MGLKLAATSGGSIELVPTNTASNFTATMPAGTGTVAVNGVSSNIVSGTAVASTSGTSIDFTGIPSWVKRITVMFSGVSTNGTSNIQIQVGTSGVITTSGYVGAVSNQAGTAVANSAGFLVANSVLAADIYWGLITLVKSGANATQIIASSNLANSNVANNRYGAGGVTPANVIDTVRITTAGGTDTFDAGLINILYE
jgi:hypothetical protein